MLQVCLMMKDFQMCVWCPELQRDLHWRLRKDGDNSRMQTHISNSYISSKSCYWFYAPWAVKWWLSIRPLTSCVTAGGSLPVCAGCKQRIYDEQYLQALNTDWHTICFRYVQHKLTAHHVNTNSTSSRLKGQRWSVSVLEWMNEWMSVECPLLSSLYCQLSYKGVKSPENL